MRMDITQKLGIGTVQFGLDYGISNKNGITTFDEVGEILYFAKSKGIDLLDTAFAYGKSEEVLGKLGVKDFKVVSKFLPESSEYSVEKQINTSLNRLNLKSLYGILAHRPLDLINSKETLDLLQKLKKDKVVKKIGLSFNTVEEAEKTINEGFLPDIIQVPYNYFDSRFVPFMKYFKNRKCEIHARSAFMQGLFFTDINELSDFFDELKPELKKIQTYGDQLPGMLIKHCLKNSHIDKVIIGINTKEQLLKNINSIENCEELPLKTINLKPEILMPSKWPK